MTEKRFNLIEVNGNIEDSCTQAVYDGGEDVFELLDCMNALHEENTRLKDKDIMFSPQRHSKTVRMDFLERYNKLVGFENEVKETLEAKYEKCDTIGKYVIKDIADELGIDLE